MRTKKLKSRLSRKVIRGGSFIFGPKKYTPVFTCDSSENKMCEGMDRVGKAITDEKSYPIQLASDDRKNMYAYFEDSGSIELLETVANKGLDGINLNKYKVILKILKSIFYSKGYYEEVEVLRKLEKKNTILPDEQTKIKEYIKQLPSILMSYEELYDKIIAMEQDLIARKEKITGITEEETQKKIDLKEKKLLEEKRFFLSADQAIAATAPATTAAVATANKAMNKAANSATTANATANATANKAMNSATTAPAVAPAVAPATNPLIKDANSNTNPNGITRSP